MHTPRPSLLLLSALLVGLASCQSAQPGATTTTQPAEATAAPATGAATEAAARAAVARFVQQQPNATIYQLDSARALDVDDHWQVLVPRTDWAKRMPNKAAFEVNKQTGAVTTMAVK